MADSARGSYRQIMRATSIFGGVQVFQIIIGVIRSKCIAVLLGPAGMGIAGLLQASIDMMAALTGFGLSTSAIKNISSAQAQGDEEKVGRTIAVFKRLVWGTGLLGALLTLLLSPYLSRITFGNQEYTWAFVVLSATLLMNQISTGQSTLLRAMRQIKQMAKASLIGSTLGLVTTIPLYYVYGAKAIVPGILLTSLITLLLTGHYAAKLSFARLKIGFAAMRSEGKEMLTMGFLISLSSIVTLAFSYVVRIFIGHYGSVADVGLYNAGFAIVNTYVGMVFTAMATDYYPKLSAAANDVKKTNESVNQQAEIALLILSPILLVFIVCIKWVIVVLYSEAFLPVDNMILFAAVGMLFKTLSWAIAFIFLARGASQLFFWNELIANVYILGLNLAGYYGYGLTGLGLSFLISYMLYALQVYLVSKKRFGYVMDSELFLLFSVNAVFISIGLISVQFFTPLFAYLTGGGLFMASAVLSLYFLDKRLGWRAKYR